MPAETEKTVGQLVVEQPARARIFERLGIDFCCGGKKPLAVACRELGLDAGTVTKMLDAIGAAAPANEDQRDWSQASLSQLCDHIESTHHAYLKSELPRLEAITDRVAARHGSHRPALVQVRDIFRTLREEMESHMMKEERVLFPLIRAIDAGEGDHSHCGSISSPIGVMVAEHDSAGAALQQMRDLTDNYTPPEDACNTYRAMLSGLAELEADMHQHVHKENNILFPRAADAEKLAVAGSR